MTEVVWGLELPAAFVCLCRWLIVLQDLGQNEDGDEGSEGKGSQENVACGLPSRLPSMANSPPWEKLGGVISVAAIVIVVKRCVRKTGKKGHRASKRIEE